MMHPGLRHWTLAFAVAAALHLAALITLHEPQSGAVGFGTGGVEVSLEPGGRAAEAVAAIEPVIAEAEPLTADVAEVATPEPEVVEAMRPQEMVQMAEALPVAQAVEAVEATASAEPAPAETTQPVETVEPPPANPAEAVLEVQAVEAAETLTIVEAIPTEPARSAEEVEETTAQRMVADIVPPVKPVDAAREKLDAPTAQPEAAPAQPAGEGGRSGANAQTGTNTVVGASGGGMPGEMADYQALLSAWLNKHKQYPRRAQQRRQEGVAHLRFVIDREGRVLSFSLERSSGHALLDREVERMIERASPLPPVPDEIQQAQLEFVVPVTFALR